MFPASSTKIAVKLFFTAPLPEKARTAWNPLQLKPEFPPNQDGRPSFYPAFPSHTADAKLMISFFTLPQIIEPTVLHPAQDIIHCGEFHVVITQTSLQAFPTHKNSLTIENIVHGFVRSKALLIGHNKNAAFFIGKEGVEGRQ